ncbi:UNVERIFIED_ORG: hypothetical protein GGD58_001115 [Rhizobium pisi]
MIHSITSIRQYGAEKSMRYVPDFSLDSEKPSQPSANCGATTAPPLRRAKIAGGNAQNVMLDCCCAGLCGFGSHVQVQGKPMFGIEHARLPAFLSGGLRVN